MQRQAEVVRTQSTFGLIVIYFRILHYAPVAFILLGVVHRLRGTEAAMVSTVEGEAGLDMDRS